VGGLVSLEQIGQQLGARAINLQKSYKQILDDSAKDLQDSDTQKQAFARFRIEQAKKGLKALDYLSKNLYRLGKSLSDIPSGMVADVIRVQTIPFFDRILSAGELHLAFLKGTVDVRTPGGHGRQQRRRGPAG